MKENNCFFFQNETAIYDQQIDLPQKRFWGLKVFFPSRNDMDNEIRRF